MPERDAYGSFVLTVRTNGDEVIASLEDAGYTIVSPDEPPPPIEEDAAYWRKMYEERLALEEDGFTALLAERDRYRETLRDVEEVAGRFARRGHPGFEYEDISQALAVALQELSVIQRRAAAASDEPTTSSAAATGEDEWERDS